MSSDDKILFIYIAAAILLGAAAFLAWLIGFLHGSTLSCGIAGLGLLVRAIYSSIKKRRSK